MATNTDVAPAIPAVKTYRVAHAFIISDIMAKFDNTESVSSTPFFCPEDPLSPTFVVEIGFGDPVADSYSVGVSILHGEITQTKLTVKFNNIDWQLLQTKVSSASTMLKYPDDSFFWDNWISRDRIRQYEADGLRVLVELEFQQIADTLPVAPPSCGRSDRYHEDFLEMFEAGTATDVTFLIRGQKVKAHKAVLMARCSYFKTMFASGMKEALEGEVKVTDVKIRVFKELLKFIYGGKEPAFRKDVTADLLIVADKYGLVELKDICEKQLIAHLSAENVVDYLLLADELNCSYLLNVATPLIRTHVQTLGANKELDKLKANPKLLLEMLRFGLGDLSF